MDAEPIRYTATRRYWLWALWIALRYGLRIAVTDRVDADDWPGTVVALGPRTVYVWLDAGTVIDVHPTELRGKVEHR